MEMDFLVTVLVYRWLSQSLWTSPVTSEGVG